MENNIIIRQNAINNAHPLSQPLIHPYSCPFLHQTVLKHGPQPISSKKIDKWRWFFQNKW